MTVAGLPLAIDAVPTVLGGLDVAVDGLVAAIDALPVAIEGLPAAIGGIDLVQVATLALAAGSSALGLGIAYLAYRGLRRHDSRQMLYLSAGMILLFGVAYAVAALGSILFHYWLLPLPYQDPFRLVVRAVQFAGLVCIAYSLYLGRGAAR